MKSTSKRIRKWPILEMFGIFLCGGGLCIALASVGVSYSQEMMTREKQQLLGQVDEMKAALVAAKVPDDQISGLLRIHKATLVNEASHEHFIILSFFVLLGLLLSSVGLTVMLWAKLRILAEAHIHTPHAA